MASGLFYAGQILTASLLNSIAPNGVVKPAAQSVTSSTTLVSDTDLLAALDANATYALVCQVGYTGGTEGSSDLKIQWSVPSGATLAWGCAYLDTTGSSHWSQFQGNTDTIVAGTNGAGVNRQLWIVGSVVMGTTADSLTLQWAQGTSNGTATQVLAGSWLAMWRLS